MTDAVTRASLESVTRALQTAKSDLKEVSRMTPVNALARIDLVLERLAYVRAMIDELRAQQGGNHG